MAPARKIAAIAGTYRKGKVIDSAASEVLRGAESRGAGTMGAKVQTALYYGAVAQTPDATLSKADLDKAYEAGVRLGASLG